MTGKQLAAVLSILGLVAMMFVHKPIETKSDFQLWKERFGIKYESMFEEAYRERIFLENLEAINLHNINEHKTYTQGVNQFTGMTQEEFEQNYLGLIVPTEEIVTDSVLEVALEDTDWVAQGYVTAVKNQGQCGSCWAFSTTGGLEGLSKAKGNLESFSEQQLVDCSGPYGNQACNGGLMTNAFKFVKDKGKKLFNI